MKRPKSNLEETLKLHLMASGLWPRFVRELEFAKPRKFRADFAFPHAMLLIECEGGVWQGGRHTRGLGFMRDCEKQNLAAEMGYRVLRYTMAQIKDGSAIQQIERILAHPPTITLPILPQRKPFIRLEDLP
jgi:very-short-patch-repair endonuclease